MIAYKLENTLSEFGGVSRGVCNTRQNELVDVKEYTNISLEDNIIKCDQTDARINKDHLVSMNLWVLNPSIFAYLNKAFEIFYDSNKDKASEELFLPTVINNLIKGKQLMVRLNSTEASWFGLTYVKDLDQAKASISLLINRGEYPVNIEL